MYRAGNVAAGKQNLSSARGDKMPRSRPFALGRRRERAAQLARLDIRTVEDLLLHRPRRYEDRRHFRNIAELTKDEAATVRGTIVALRPQTVSRRQQIGF